MIKKIAVIGGGSAGVIAASYLKSYWGNNVNIDMIYDHSNPGIGVGESLTPAIWKYLDRVGITREDLIKNVNATVKLGLRFDNWPGDGSNFYHNFNHFEDHEYNLIAAYDTAYEKYSGDSSYDPFYMENCVIPQDPYAQQSLHIDATLFSKFIEEKFKDRITIINDIVDNVVVKDGEIDHIVLKNSGKYSADFYIDATGFGHVLMKHMGAEWIDKSDELPVDRCIPNPVPWEFKKQPPYTISEAIDNGWILQVPLQNRWGSGYLYSSKFTTDEEAFEQFEKWCQKKYNKPLTNTSKVLKFKSGYWKQQWVGNVIATGLCSGFAEPLEATNIHHTIEQIDQFVHNCSLNYTNYDIKNYNKYANEFYENIYLYLRFCYSTGRTDSEFWKYMTKNTPEYVKDLNEKVSSDFLTYYDLEGPMFSFGNFTRVSNGMKKTDSKRIREILKKRNLTDRAERASIEMRFKKEEAKTKIIDHKSYINYVVKEWKND